MSPNAIRCTALICTLTLWTGQIHGHSVAQIMNAKRIASPELVATTKTGDILTFIIQVTPFPNNATQGAGAYITEYIPGNTELVSARLIDRDGNTVVPNRGPRMDDGFGPQGRHGKFDGLGLLQGSMSAVYSDTGIFFSTDPRTARVPDNAFLTVANGIEIGLNPTGAGQLDQALGFNGPPYYSHNDWDRTQTRATYRSDAIPAGFSVVALTIIEPFVVMTQDATVTSSSTSAGSDVRYSITLTNEGTSDADVDGTSSYIAISLPAGFSYCAPPTCAQPIINASGVANPAITGDVLTLPWSWNSAVTWAPASHRASTPSTFAAGSMTLA